MDEAHRSQIASERFNFGLTMLVSRMLRGLGRSTAKCILDEVDVENHTHGDIWAFAEDSPTLHAAFNRRGITVSTGLIRRAQLAILAAGPRTPICDKCGDLGIVVEGGRARILTVGDSCPNMRPCGKVIDNKDFSWNFVVSEPWTERTVFQSDDGQLLTFRKLALSLGQPFMRAFLDSRRSDTKILAIIRELPGFGVSDLAFAAQMVGHLWNHGFFTPEHARDDLFRPPPSSTRRRIAPATSSQSLGSSR